jgi:AcrR family transcriptional regulator
MSVVSAAFSVGEESMTRPINEDLPERILAAAQQIVAKQGHRALNMRSVAKQVGVTPTTLYYYFDSKDRIVLELRLRAARILNEKVSQIDRTEWPAAAIRALGEAYIDFAEANPHLYRLLMEVRPKHPIATEDHRRTLCSSYFAAKEMLTTLVEQGIRDCDPAELALIGWIMLHGFASLLTAGTLEAVTGMEREVIRSTFLEAYSIGSSPADGVCHDDPS